MQGDLTSIGIFPPIRTVYSGTTLTRQTHKGSRNG